MRRSPRAEPRRQAKISLCFFQTDGTGENRGRLLQNAVFRGQQENCLLKKLVRMAEAAILTNFFFILFKMKGCSRLFLWVFFSSVDADGDLHSAFSAEPGRLREESSLRQKGFSASGAVIEPFLPDPAYNNQNTRRDDHPKQSRPQGCSFDMQLHRRTPFRPPRRYYACSQGQPGSPPSRRQQPRQPLSPSHRR